MVEPNPFQTVWVVLVGYDVEEVRAFSSLETAQQFTAGNPVLRSGPYECPVER